MNRVEGSKDYIIEHLLSREILSGLYPNIQFYTLTPRISHIVVPEYANKELDELRKAGIGIFTPILFGLDIEEALEEVNISSFHESPLGELTGKGTLIGFVDTGIQYTNPIFQYEDRTTRIKSIWDQTIEGNPPINYGMENYDFGSVYTEEDINKALLAENPYEVVPSQDTDGHGTYLAGVAAGKDRIGDTRYTGGAPDADIVVVKLREAKTYLREENLLPDEVAAYQANDIMEGINYLVSVAINLNKPIVICLALGSNQGAHNGLTIIERFLNSFADIYNVILVSSSGNEGNKAHHYAGTIKQGERQEIEINVEEGEKGFTVHLWATGSDKISVGFRTPLGNTIQEVPTIFTEVQSFSFNLEKSRVTLDYEFPNLITGSQSAELKFINPIAGIWKLYIYGSKILFEEYDLWLPREEFIKQGTRFLRPDPLTTVSIPSTAEKLIVVGNYDVLSNGIYPSSGRGPTTNAIIKPDIIAPGVNILGPNLDGGYIPMTGTGASTAITVSACALLLQWAIIEGRFPIINTNIARTILIRGAKRDANVTYPNPIEGYGKLDLRESIQNI
ncbi:S8 family peptidase [Niameybacter massiliensis]|uniref:S8 family peptidase n=1 Tax=Holtiella tumoricola TaxID=3018743 RepID=A0AA42DQT4_9FIRM|nr:S8 family peptidase [Holtiella tumoricola]MDA3733477.1 S8 family peptidase [Holtiella tumoricola]